MFNKIEKISMSFKANLCCSNEQLIEKTKKINNQYRIKYVLFNKQI